jgi:hypothetical protein
VERTPCAISHDFANVLTVIHGSADLVKRHIGPEHRAAADVDRLIRAAEEATALNRELRAIACAGEAVS